MHGRGSLRTLDSGAKGRYAAVQGPEAISYQYIRKPCLHLQTIKAQSSATLQPLNPEFPLAPLLGSAKDPLGVVDPGADSQTHVSGTLAWGNVWWGGGQAPKKALTTLRFGLKPYTLP